jgi:hypothetical protein
MSPVIFITGCAAKKLGMRKANERIVPNLIRQRLARSAVSYIVKRLKHERLWRSSLAVSVQNRDRQGADFPVAGPAGVTPAFRITVRVDSSPMRAPSSGDVPGGTRPIGSGLTASS